MSAAALESERLVLRRFALEDFDAYAARWADPRVVAFIGGEPREIEESWIRFQRHAGHWALMGYGSWGVFERASGRQIGEAGFFDGKRDINPPLEAPELGWAFDADAWGKGYATEAVRAALAWGDAHLGKRFVCIIDPDNAASLRVAQKAGFRAYAQTTYKGETTILLER